jgi:hypothetical protein
MRRLVKAKLSLPFEVGDTILYGKYKNKKGKIVSFGTNPKGQATVVIEPIPKGRKQNKEMGLFKIWTAPADASKGTTMKAVKATLKKRVKASSKLYVDRLDDAFYTFVDSDLESSLSKIGRATMRKQAGKYLTSLFYVEQPEMGRCMVQVEHKGDNFVMLAEGGKKSWPVTKVSADMVAVAILDIMKANSMRA